jgi:hypothetical protein
MGVFAYPDHKVEGQTLGTYYDWFEPGQPANGVYWHLTNYVKGENFSDSHPRDRDGKYRQGSPWLMHQRTVRHWGDFNATFRPSWGRAYSGYYIVSSSFDSVPMDIVPADYTTQDATEDAVAYGAQAWAKLKPDTPDFTPLLSLYELKDFLPGLKELVKKKKRRVDKRVKKIEEKLTSRQAVSRVGKFHLSLQFGWAPLYKDICDFIDAFENRNRRYRQLLRDNERWVRRRAVLNKDGHDRDEWEQTGFTTLSTPYNPAIQPTHVTQCYGGGNATTRTIEHESLVVWCEGKSKYFLPHVFKEFPMAAKRQILGLNVTPEVVYNAMPWTWLADYFGGLGNVISAISPGIADRVIFEYAFVMRQLQKRRREQCTQYMYISTTETRRVFANRERFDILKTRIAASPFGFGLDEDGLSPSQWGILGALGASSL